MTEEITKQLGLKDKEAVLYGACLELGPSKIKDLASFTEINRGTLYDVARSLFKKGLLSSTQKKNITFFVANNPKSYIKQVERQIDSAKKVLPEIELLLNSSSYRPKIRYFEGKDGIKAVYEETLKCKSKMIYCLASAKDMLDTVGADFMRDFTKRRARKNIKMKSLNDPNGEVNDNQVNHSTHTDQSLLREAKIGPNSLRIPGMVEIYDNQVVMMSTKKENFGFIIESEEFASMMKQIYEILWSQSVDDKDYYKGE